MQPVVPGPDAAAAWGVADGRTTEPTHENPAEVAYSATAAPQLVARHTTTAPPTSEGLRNEGTTTTTPASALDSGGGAVLETYAV